MAAVNKDPFVGSARANNLPDTFLGVVQAGSSQAIKIGEICAYNKTAGYWVPISAVNDYIYALAISAEEQKAADSARYMKFYSLHPEDKFEFELAAARSLAIGNCFILTASYSQKLTYSAAENWVARNVDDGHYPETGTTIRNRSYAIVTFNPALTYWGLIRSGQFWGSPKLFVTGATALTLYEEQSGLIISNLGGGADTAIHILPQAARKGTRYKAICQAAFDTGFDPGTAGAIYVEGAKQTDDKYVTVDAIGDSIEVVADGAGDWHADVIVSSAADQTGAIDIQG